MGLWVMFISFLMLFSKWTKIKPETETMNVTGTKVTVAVWAEHKEPPAPTFWSPGCWSSHSGRINGRALGGQRRTRDPRFHPLPSQVRGAPAGPLELMRPVLLCLQCPPKSSGSSLILEPQLTLPDPGEHLSTPEPAKSRGLRIFRRPSSPQPEPEI